MDDNMDEGVNEGVKMKTRIDISTATVKELEENLVMLEVSKTFEEAQSQLEKIEKVIVAINAELLLRKLGTSSAELFILNHAQ